MTIKEIPIKLNKIENHSDKEVIKDALEIRKESLELFAQEKYQEALQRAVDGLRKLRDFSNYSDREFRAMLAMLLFDVAELHFALKDFKQSEKEVEMLFKVLDNLLKDDAERFGEYHVMAMELSTRILRSRKKTLELLAKQQINTGILYEKVNAGVQAATDKLVDSLKKGAELMASTGDYRGAARFYIEAIKIANKRAGKVTKREVRMTVDLAGVMMHSRSQLARARRLLSAILPHAIALENLELEQEILGKIANIDADTAHEPAWRTFLEKVQHTAKKHIKRASEKVAETTPEKE
ncbi:MAG: hypothetical protein NC204_04140 [Candidatus Amulumruptor caecigallinarius]|nr:hypothetical protein [Candidatus Amulumruptor caecigallinarius]